MSTKMSSAGKASSYETACSSKSLETETAHKAISARVCIEKDTNVNVHTLWSGIFNHIKVLT